MGTGNGLRPLMVYSRVVENLTRLNGIEVCLSSVYLVSSRRYKPPPEVNMLKGDRPSGMSHSVRKDSSLSSTTTEYSYSC
jgi:hypothetical protein